MNASRIKIGLFVWSVLILLNGCVNDSNSTNEIPSDTSSEENQISDEVVQLPYEVVYDAETNLFSIEENSDTSQTSLNANMLVHALENRYPEISLRVGDKRKDTLDVYIDDASYLTQSIGTAGASAYMAEATYAFTALDSINTVNFIFETGDHASPGPYQRKDFDNFQ